MQLARSALLSLLATALVACGDDGPVIAPEQPSASVARLRIVNAAPGTSGVEVVATGSATPLATLDFRGVTPSCVQVPAGVQQTITFRSGTTTIASVAQTFGANERWTVLVSANGTNRRALALSDVHTAVAGNNALRFINATSASGDVYVTTPTGTPGLSSRAVGGSGPIAMSNEQPAYLARAATDTRVRLFNEGATTGTPRADITLTGLPSSRLATVVFTDAGTPAGPTAFIVLPCE